MYPPNDVLIGILRISKMFNSQNNVLHDKAVKPVPSVWTVTKVLDVEPFINETLNMFTTIWRASS